jgi:hypothetical protein
MVGWVGAGRTEIVAARVAENPKTLQPILCQRKNSWDWVSKLVMDHCLTRSPRTLIRIYGVGGPSDLNIPVWLVIDVQLLTSSAQV